MILASTADFQHETFTLSMELLGGEIIIAAVGKLKNSYWLEAQKEYLKRLERYTDLELIEVKDFIGHGHPDAVAVQKEGEQLLKTTIQSRQRILLTPQGKSMKSEEFASWLRSLIENHHRISFLIGGPVGFSVPVTEAANHKLSLSPLTFPHELARVMLLEQIYRAATIISGEKYHK